MLRAPLPTTLNYNLAIHSTVSFWTVQKDQASLNAPASTTRPTPVQTGRLRRRRPPSLSAALGRARIDRPGAADGRAPHQGGAVSDGQEPGQFRVRGDPFAQQDNGAGACPLRVRRSPRERDRGRQQRHGEDPYCSWIGAGGLPERSEE